MRKFEGTKGEWVVNNNYGWIESSADGKVVIGGSQPATKEDMQLIAAAPDLLEALQSFISCYDKGVDLNDTDCAYEFDNARKAINKALGGE